MAQSHHEGSRMARHDTAYLNGCFKGMEAVDARGMLGLSSLRCFSLLPGHNPSLELFFPSLADEKGVNQETDVCA